MRKRRMHGENAVGAGAAADAFGARAPMRAPRRRLDPRWMALTVCLALVRTLLLVHSPNSSPGPAPYLAPASGSARSAAHAVHEPPALPSCEVANISTPTASEGVCTRGAGLPGPISVFNVVDRSHVLRMPEYETRLLGTEIAPTHTRSGIRSTTRTVAPSSFRSSSPSPTLATARFCSNRPGAACATRPTPSIRSWNC